MPTSDWTRLVRWLSARRDVQQVIWGFVAIVLAWVIGKSIAGQKYDYPIMLVGAMIFLVVFSRRHSLIILFPAVLAMPNIGLDIPGPWAITVEDAFTLLIFGTYLGRAILRRYYLVPRDDPIAVNFILFVGIAIICIIQVANVSPNNLLFNTKELLRLAELAMCYLALTDALDSPKHIMRLVQGLLIWSVWMIAVSFWIYLTLSPFWYFILTMKPAFIFLRTKILRLVSIAGSTSYTGIYYALILALAAYYQPLFANKGRKVLGATLIGLILACIFFSFNRGTWVGILFGLSVLVLQGQINRRRVALSILLIAGLAVLMGTSVFGEIDVEQKVVDLVHYSSSSAESRIVRWLSAVNVVMDHPLLGVGYNNYAFVYGNYSILEGFQPSYGSPHNMYVDILTGTGFIGFTVFMALMVQIWRRMRSNLRAPLPPDLMRLSQGIFLAHLFFLGSSFFDSFLFKPHHSSYIIIALWAMSTAIYRLHSGKRPDSGSLAPAPSATPSGGASR